MAIGAITSAPSRLPNVLAWLLACATFPLIWVGGLVTTYDAGMAVPDWPNTYGYNLFLYPWQTWLSGPWDLFIEHGHRLLGAFVGLLALTLMLLVSVVDRRSWVKLLAVVTVFAVIFQGLLGGTRVLFDDRQLAMIHGCFGPAFFGLTVVMIGVTSAFWRNCDVNQKSTTFSYKMQFYLISIPLLVYIQLVLGAALRHFPIHASSDAFKGVVVFHLILASVIALQVVLFCRATIRQRVGRVVSVPAIVQCVLVLVQLLLGVGTWVAKYNWPGWLVGFDWAANSVVQEKSIGQALIVTSHVATGSLILAVSVWTSLVFFRIFSPVQNFFGVSTINSDNASLAVRAEVSA